MNLREKLGAAWDLGRLVVRRRALFLVPFFLFLLLGLFLVLVWESPALIPFFYAIF
jgi:hypothetical protein